MSAALTKPSVAADSSRDATERYLDLLRDHQQRYLEAAGAAAAEVRGMDQLESIAASTLQLSRQFFDAQRAIVGRVGKHRAELVDDNAVDDLLDLAAWDAAAATRQLAALLDGWWAALNSAAGAAMDQAAARRALVRQVDRIETKHGPASATSAAPGAPVVCLPPSVRALLDRSDGSDLRSLLRQLGEALDAFTPSAETACPVAAPAEAPSGAMRALPPPVFPSPSARASVIAASLGAALVAPAAVIESTTTGELRIRELVETTTSVSPTSSADPLTRLERLEQDRRPFWADADGAEQRDGGWFPTPAVASIAVATAALATALALIG